VAIDLSFEENDGVEVVAFDSRAYTWTRKQLVHAQGHVRIGEVEKSLAAPAIVDDSAGYHPRHAWWRWSAGAGVDVLGRAVAWNLVEGIHDPPVNSERTVWLDGVPHEVAPVRFAEDLSEITFAGGERLSFRAEAVRQRRDNLLLIRSSYLQPFGVFSGTLPEGIELREAYGVMEKHEAYW
jgi:hypothetical protein